MFLAGIDRRSPTSQPRVHALAVCTTSSVVWRMAKRRSVLGSSAPGSRPASHRTWKPLQMPSTGPPSAAKRADLDHHGREARDGADAQVVAVGEAAGDDDGVDALEVRVAVPELHRVARERAGEARVRVVAGAGEGDDAERGHSTIS